MADRGAQSGGYSGGGGPSLPAGLRSQTAKGAMLIAAAVIIGIVLLQIIDPGKSGPVGARTTNSTASTTSTTTTTKKSGSTTSTTAKTTGKTPATLHLLVLNAGGVTGSAGRVSTNLKNQGFTNQGQPSNSASKITGYKVECVAGNETQQSKIVQLLGPGTTKGTLTPPLPADAAGYDCVVLVGSG
jgi:hypothetical protein